MSSESYQEAKKIVLKNKDLADFVGGRPSKLIKKAEEKLDLRFTGLYLDFLQTFGAGNFGAQEIYGIINEDFEHSSVPDAIWYTLTERIETNLPNNLLVIYDTGSDELFCLDFSKLNEKEEPKVISFVPEIELKNQAHEIIANDFGDFLFNLVKQEI
jgi:SMI1 / KNR4 family.